MITNEQAEKFRQIYCLRMDEFTRSFPEESYYTVQIKAFQSALDYYEQSKIRPKTEFERIIEEDAIQVQANYEEAVRKGIIGVAKNMPKD